jgi:hypothetical protein
MALPAHLPDLPLPPELAAEQPPIPDHELATMEAAAVELAEEAGLDLSEAVGLVNDSEGAPRWEITDLGAAEWAMRHVAEAAAQQAALQAQADEWGHRIQQWYHQAAMPLLARRTFFEGHLNRWAIAEREAGHGKTQTMPSGRVMTREQKPAVEVADEAAVIAWADERGVGDDVAPAQPRKVYVNPLRDHVQARPVVTAARVVLSDGEVLYWHADTHEQPLPGVGDGWPSPEEAEALVAQVEPQAWHLEALDTDGQPVPGVTIRPGKVTATVQAEQP